jgi:hypothetical protein
MNSIEIIPKDLFRYWVGLAPGAFTVKDLSRHVDKQQVYVDMCEELVDEGVLDRHGVRRGWYIPRHTELERMNYKNVSATPVDIWLPFGLSDYVELYNNSVVIVSGAPNAGKTAILLNMVLQNELKGWDIHYFNSEMSAEEFSKRLEKFYPHRTLDDWNFNAYYRADRFADVVVPGRNSLNIIDFLEVHDEFYVVGARIKEIHDRLRGGLAVIALQKNPGSNTGLGGYRSLEVARLALAIDKGRVKITKAKNFRKPDYNPNGRKRDFNIVNGCQLLGKGKWYLEDPKPIGG